MGKKPKHAVYELPKEVQDKHNERARSGASGIHEDKKAKKAGNVGYTNRQGSRSSKRRAAVNDQDVPRTKTRQQNDVGEFFHYNFHYKISKKFLKPLIAPESKCFRGN